MCHKFLSTSYWICLVKRDAPDGRRRYPISILPTLVVRPGPPSTSSQAEAVQLSSALSLQTPSHQYWQDHTPEAKAHTCAVNAEIKQLFQTSPPSSPMSHPFTYDEITEAIKTLKNGKAPENDNIHTEFLKLRDGSNASSQLVCYHQPCHQDGRQQRPLLFWSPRNQQMILRATDPSRCYLTSISCLRDWYSAGSTTRSRLNYPAPKLAFEKENQQLIR